MWIIKDRILLEVHIGVAIYERLKPMSRVLRVTRPVKARVRLIETALEDTENVSVPLGDLVSVGVLYLGALYLGDL